LPLCYHAEAAACRQLRDQRGRLLWRTQRMRPSLRQARRTGLKPGCIHGRTLMKKTLLLTMAAAMLALASAQSMAMIVVDRDGQYWDCCWQRETLVCIPLDYMPPLDP
jgi:hypothetical protein